MKTKTINTNKIAFLGGMLCLSTLSCLATYAFTASALMMPITFVVMQKLTKSITKEMRL